MSVRDMREKTPDIADARPGYASLTLAMTVKAVDALIRRFLHELVACPLPRNLRRNNRPRSSCRVPIPMETNTGEI